MIAALAGLLASGENSASLQRDQCLNAFGVITLFTGLAGITLVSLVYLLLKRIGRRVVKEGLPKSRGARR
jgi:hypothetical protein